MIDNPTLETNLLLYSSLISALTLSSSTISSVVVTDSNWRLDRLSMNLACSCLTETLALCCLVSTRADSAL